MSKELYHLTDWVPTLNKLAGGPELTKAVDGVDIWPSLSKGLPSPREEVLLRADSISREYALRWNQYKIVSGIEEHNGERVDKW